MIAKVLSRDLSVAFMFSVYASPFSEGNFLFHFMIELSKLCQYLEYSHRSSIDFSRKMVSFRG